MRAEYDAKVRRLLEALRTLAQSLEEEAPSAHSRLVYGPPAAALAAAERCLRAAAAAGASRSELAAVASDLTAPLAEAKAAATKGEVPLARPDLLAEVDDLRTVFRESRYASIP